MTFDERVVCSYNTANSGGGESRGVVLVKSVIDSGEGFVRLSFVWAARMP